MRKIPYKPQRGKNQLKLSTNSKNRELFGKLFMASCRYKDVWSGITIRLQVSASLLGQDKRKMPKHNPGNVSAPKI